MHGSSGSIGEDLKAQRLAKGLTLDELSTRTKIPVRSLEALESNRFDQLPGLVFLRGFVRQCARELDLDGEAMAARLPNVSVESQPLPEAPARVGRGPRDPRITAAFASVLWLVAGAGAITGAWYYYNNYGHTLLRSVTATAPAAKSSSTPATTTSSVNSNSAVQHVSAPAPAPNEFDGSRPVQVVLTAHEAAWVQISADGRTAFVGLLQPNDTKSIAADDHVKIVTGNAGGVDIALNGRRLDPIGTSGQVKTVSLNADGMHSVERTQPAASPL